MQIDASVSESLQTIREWPRKRDSWSCLDENVWCVPYKGRLVGFESISKVVIGTLPSKRVIDFDDLTLAMTKAFTVKCERSIDHQCFVFECGFCTCHSVTPIEAISVILVPRPTGHFHFRSMKSVRNFHRVVFRSWNQTQFIQMKDSIWEKFWWNKNFDRTKKRKNNMCSETAIKFLSWPNFPQSVGRGQTEPFFLFWPYVIYFTKLHVYVYFQISTHNCAQ